MKELILLRGVPGSGKSTLASVLAGDVYPIYSADMFFEIDLHFWFNYFHGRSYV